MYNRDFINRTAVFERVILWYKFSYTFSFCCVWIDSLLFGCLIYAAEFSILFNSNRRRTELAYIRTRIYIVDGSRVSSGNRVMGKFSPSPSSSLARTPSILLLVNQITKIGAWTGRRELLPTSNHVSISITYRRHGLMYAIINREETKIGRPECF